MKYHKPMDILTKVYERNIIKTAITITIGIAKTRKSMNRSHCLKLKLLSLESVR